MAAGWGMCFSERTVDDASSSLAAGMCRNTQYATVLIHYAVIIIFEMFSLFYTFSFTATTWGIVTFSVLFPVLLYKEQLIYKRPE